MQKNFIFNFGRKEKGGRLVDRKENNKKFF